jgi:hypothetical protein
MVYNGKTKIDNVNRQHNNVNKWNMWEKWWKRIIERKKKSNDVSSYGNWEQNKLMVLIKCKHVKHAFSKGIATSNNAHDTYCTIVEHDCEQALKACSF